MTDKPGYVGQYGQQTGIARVAEAKKKRRAFWANWKPKPKGAK